MQTEIEVTQSDSSEVPAPEVLIPEARQHRRQRYRRRSIVVVIAVLVGAVLTVSGLLLFRGPAASGRADHRPSSPAPAAVATAGVVYFRPVLCFAPAYTPPAAGSTVATPPGFGDVPPCSAASALTATNIGAMPTNTPSGFSDNSIAPDPKYANLPSTSIHKPGYASSTVLLAGLRGACDGATAIRCVLGPAELSSGDIDKATVHQTQTGQWVVDYTMAGSANAALWDKVAQRNFHQMLGIELNGVVYSAPLMQPMQASFSSFDGRGEISGSLTHARAVQLAKQLAEHRSH